MFTYRSKMLKLLILGLAISFINGKFQKNVLEKLEA
jgi:hypothetical protein